MSQLLKVCVGILHQPATQQVLLACRPPGKVWAGYWEFPGGKLEASEDCFSALSRELNEELGIYTVVSDLAYLGKLEHQYSHGLVQLEVCLVSNWSGTIRGCEEQALNWYCYNDGTNVPVEPLLPTTMAIIELMRARFLEKELLNATVS